ncbi:helix-turn-helix domain-containing protein [Streptomyces sp. SID8352]|uniref:ArsR/SmtB family transcription factor n=1 Tax=unclassified Streptomyces TaxID=2593676 RepID=UPI00136B9515|nr:helix-turn-helix domain-containing protein [Streptomyces sp. SID8352]MYU23709.1 helix-turn-helix domain-containing protein [Streptomyces sp. SID8352]
MALRHPKAEEIRLEDVLTALSNPTRLKVVRTLAEAGPTPCGSLLEGVPKSTLTHHWRVLREGGLIWQEAVGREYTLTLRRDDLERRFPGLLPSVLRAAGTR